MLGINQLIHLRWEAFLRLKITRTDIDKTTKDADCYIRVIKIKI